MAGVPEVSAFRRVLTLGTPRSLGVALPLQNLSPWTVEWSSTWPLCKTPGELRQKRVNVQQACRDSETKTDVAQPSMHPGSDPSRPSSIADVRWWIRGFSVLRNSQALAHYKVLAGALPQHNGQKHDHSVVQKSLFFHHPDVCDRWSTAGDPIGMRGRLGRVRFGFRVRALCIPAADSLAPFAKRFGRFRCCSCCGVLVSTAAQLARRSRHGDPVFVIWAQALLILRRLIYFLSV